jgi:hypothetical protein
MGISNIYTIFRTIISENLELMILNGDSLTNSSYTTVCLSYLLLLAMSINISVR